MKNRFFLNGFEQEFFLFFSIILLILGSAEFGRPIHPAEYSGFFFLSEISELIPNRKKKDFFVLSWYRTRDLRSETLFSLSFSQPEKSDRKNRPNT